MSSELDSNMKLGPRKFPKQKRSRETFDRIVSVAEDLILETGLLRLSVREIARRSGTQIASIYQYFPGQSSITRHIVIKYNEEARAALAPAFAEADPSDPKGSLAKLQTAAFTFYRDTPITREIWPGTQADPDLRALNILDNAETAELLAGFLHILRPDAPENHIKWLSKYLVETSAQVFRSVNDNPNTGAEALLGLHLEAILSLLISK